MSKTDLTNEQVQRQLDARVRRADSIGLLGDSSGMEARAVSVALATLWRERCELLAQLPSGSASGRP